MRCEHCACRSRTLSPVGRNGPLLDEVGRKILSSEILRFGPIDTIIVARIGLAALLVSSDPQERMHS